MGKASFDVYPLAIHRGEVWALERHKRLQEHKMRVEPTLDPDEFARLAEALRQAITTPCI